MTRPETDELLAPCPGTPNCVSTEAPAADAVHWIAPMPFTDAPEDAYLRLRAALLAEPRIRIVRESEGHYLCAEARTAVFRFVDDVTLVLDAEARCVRMRSASRLGASDLGVNRRRLERLRSRFAGPAR